VAEVQRRVADFERRNDETLNLFRRNTDETVTREVSRVREDIRKQVGDDVERLRTRIEESRKAIDERDGTIRNLTDQLGALQDELRAARKFQAEAETRIEALNAKSAGIDELRDAVTKLQRRPIG